MLPKSKPQRAEASGHLWNDGAISDLDVDPDILETTPSLPKISERDLEQSKCVLGWGSFAQVYKGSYRGKEVAIKEINTTKEHWRSTLVNELYCFGMFQHENIIGVVGYIEGSDVKSPPKLVLACAKFGSLRTYLNSKKAPIKWEDTGKGIARDIARALSYMHDNDMIHCDLKSANVLLDERESGGGFIAKLTDFGLALSKEQGLRIKSRRGSPLWMAPETLSETEPKLYPASDIFGFGIVLWEMQTGERPWSDISNGKGTRKEKLNTLTNTVAVKRDRPIVPENTPPKLADLMRLCWCHNPRDRIKASTIEKRLTDAPVGERASLRRS